ncbi:MAG: LrgB family protein, partial [Spirochaetaceae bacterium]|nr:LrgB family protein [Spirochaetaceae bacterium]
MIDPLTDNPLFGVLLTLAVYFPALLIYRRRNFFLLNPVLISMTVIIVLLFVFHIPL